MNVNLIGKFCLERYNKFSFLKITHTNSFSVQHKLTFFWKGKERNGKERKGKERKVSKPALVALVHIFTTVTAHTRMGWYTGTTPRTLQCLR